MNWCKGLTWPPPMRAALETSATGTAIGGSHPDPFLSQPWFIYLLQVQQFEAEEPTAEDPALNRGMELGVGNVVGGEG